MGWEPVTFCKICGDPFDVYRAPDERVCEGCKEEQEITMYHFRDPCVHCGTPHDDVPPGPCKGDRKKAVVMAYCITRQSWQNQGGAETILGKLSSGEYQIVGRHPAEHWWNAPYYKDAEVLAPHEFRRRYPDAPVF